MINQNIAKMVKALVSECKKRSTAGSRMTSLLGQAMKYVEDLWSHSTCNEGGGEFSDDGSFGESDEESDAKVHTFDSDFDDPEGEDEDEDEGVGEEEVMTTYTKGEIENMEPYGLGKVAPSHARL